MKYMKITILVLSLLIFGCGTLGSIYMLMLGLNFGVHLLDSIPSVALVASVAGFIFSIVCYYKVKDWKMSLLISLCFIAILLSLY